MDKTFYARYRRSVNASLLLYCVLKSKIFDRVFSPGRVYILETSRFPGSRQDDEMWD